MNIYFEELDPETEKVVHWVLSNANARTRINYLYKRSGPYTIRVWAESAAGVRFIKNRYHDPKTTPVDPEEFFWIKLKSIPKNS